MNHTRIRQVSIKRGSVILTIAIISILKLASGLGRMSAPRMKINPEGK